MLRESAPGEKRVALVPAGVETLAQHGFDVVVEHSAGLDAGIGDDSYREAGASVAPASEVAAADLLVSVRDLPEGEPPSGQAGSAPPAFIGVFDPLWMPQRAQRHADNGTTAFSLDLVPRITRAQSMDVLSSMGTIAGYESVLVAASRLPQMFPLMMTAAGTLAPARVLVLGAGVAGLQAIATSRRLGAVVEGYDVRPAAVEQIRSMGARAVELDLSAAGADAAGAEDAGGYARAQSDDVAGRQQELLAPYVAASDVVITTAAIPGRASPLLLTAAMVDAMAPGSVVIDLASERGGNCAASQSDVEVDRGGVTVLAPTDLVSRCARHASQMFSRNLVAVLRHLAPDGEMDLRTDDEILAAMLVSLNGEVVNPEVAAGLGGSEDSHEADAEG
ncbi:MAG: NAD(P) transhydrogenase subunit alpha [Acidimicrobiaceae bacterium]|nr:NAD(P) transhydrogenase subunit alpha [Acidimicrobiaceae bacterium]MCY3643297.1 NAD(P) transhydrogenase subunit alpha [Acidimicrobiaceae bacterium]MDE0492662.1 NAD(P) transhydrogenase subunit alpha [Acidimicrobiaceae bacterium]MDE0665908.1 NAD(P) transhydrogenase subunit alpha [Acidimicrobiaceae bacterium]